MASEQQAPQVQDPQDPPEDAEPGPVARPWWRSRRALAAAVAGLAALAVGAALLAPDRAPDGGRDGTDARPTAAEEEGGGETSDEDAPDAAERSGDADSGDALPGAAQQRDPDRDAAAGVPDAASGAGEASLPNLDIAPAAFRDRWNVAVEELGRGYQLDEIDVRELDEGTEPGGTMVEYPVEQPVDFGFIEVRIRPDGLVSSAIVEGEPTGAPQEQDYFATMAAAVAAVTGLSGPEALDLLATDLGLDGTADVRSHVAGTEVDGVVIQIEAASGLWSFYIGGPWTS